MKTKLEAIEMLWDIGSHTILPDELANEIGEPFGIKFSVYEYKHDPADPKGPTADFTGVSCFEMAATIAAKLDVHYISKLGRGSQFREQVGASMAFLRNPDGGVVRNPQHLMSDDEERRAYCGATIPPGDQSGPLCDECNELLVEEQMIV
jgi:hypothetical protein